MSSTTFKESVDRRLLGGLVFTDAITNASTADPLRVSSDTLKLRVNRSGVYAIFDAPGFSSLTSQFTPNAATWPASQSFEITVQDPRLHYLPRRAKVQVPQPLATAFTPQQVALYPSPSGVIAPNWALVRASVTGPDGKARPWSVLQVIRSDNSVATSGMADSRGEALLAVIGLGVQVSGASSGSVTETTIPVTIQAWFDPAVLSQPAGWIPDPDDILNNLSNAALKTAKFNGSLGARQILLAKITISV